MNIWKLQSLPETWHNKKYIYFPYYFSCTNCLKGSLTKLNLTRYMIGRRGFKCLSEFTKLTTLNVDKNVLKNIDGLYSMLQYLPHLTQLSVEFGKNGSSIESTDNINNDNNTYSNIEEMTLTNFTPSSDDEVLTFMERFNGLNKLTIFGDAKNIRWPANSVSSSAIESFIKFVQTLSTYKITITADTQNTQLRNECSDFKNEELESHLVVGFIRPTTTIADNSTDNNSTVTLVRGDSGLSFDRII